LPSRSPQISGWRRSANLLQDQLSPRIRRTGSHPEGDGLVSYRNNHGGTLIVGCGSACIERVSATAPGWLVSVVRHRTAPTPRHAAEGVAGDRWRRVVGWKRLHDLGFDVPELGTRDVGLPSGCHPHMCPDPIGPDPTASPSIRSHGEGRGADLRPVCAATFAFGPLLVFCDAA
jgi:hypothetical protein